MSVGDAAMPEAALHFGRLDDLSAFVVTAMGTYAVRQLFFVAVRTDGQSGFGQSVMRPPLVATRLRVSTFRVGHLRFPANRTGFPEGSLAFAESVLHVKQRREAKIHLFSAAAALYSVSVDSASLAETGTIVPADRFQGPSPG